MYGLNQQNDFIDNPSPHLNGKRNGALTTLNS